MISGHRLTTHKAWQYESVHAKRNIENSANGGVARQDLKVSEYQEEELSVRSSRKRWKEIALALIKSGKSSRYSLGTERMRRVTSLTYLIIAYIALGWLILPIVWTRTISWGINLIILLGSGSYLLLHSSKCLYVKQILL